jgi:DNA-binding NtrC family response regulator
MPSYPSSLPLLLSGHPFPGNIRELRAMVYDAVGVHQGGMLVMELFRHHMEETRSCPVPRGAAAGGDGLFSSLHPLPTLSMVTQDLIREALRRSKGNLRMAAGWLGISHQALSKRLQRAGLRPGFFVGGNFCPFSAKS